MNVNRRRLFKLAVTPLACLAWPTAWLSSVNAQTLFADMFGDVRIAERLGQLYLSKDRNAGERGRQIALELAAYGGSSRQEQLQDRCQSDLAGLDVVVVDGWVLARSEADLCSAIHLDRSRA